MLKYSKSDKSGIPFAMLQAKPIRKVYEIDGNYDQNTQRWSGMSPSMGSTWSRSSTTWTGASGMVKDADEDNDD